MKLFTVYKTNGQIVQSGMCADNDFELQSLNDGEYVIEGISDPINDYVINKCVVKKPPKPEGFFVFDYELHQWVPDIEMQKIQVKTKRDNLLFKSDWTQIPNNPLIPEKQAEWADYRQQLRDITQQSGYPFNVVWPTQPA